MVQQGIDLSAALATFEAGTWATARPTMIGFVSAAQFEEVVAKGQIFEDLVASAHGVQTHRIQWFCIKREESLNPGWLSHTVISLFKDAIAPRWRQAGLISHKNMWDFIVDNTGDTDAFDFTKPENLEAYLSEEWLPLWYFRRWNIGELTADVRTGHAARPATKQQYKDAWNIQASAAQKPRPSPTTMRASPWVARFSPASQRSVAPPSPIRPAPTRKPASSNHRREGHARNHGNDQAQKDHPAHNGCPDPQTAGVGPAIPGRVNGPWETGPQLSQATQLGHQPARSQSQTRLVPRFRPN
ncbi:MAG: hypothetical protein HZY76_02835 [Anaerolineae bacterium]|nr:MAG: hypothetical protein HZY76_02835 [Anaerolineae bacterium]